VSHDGETRMWNWVELPRFATFCKRICEELGLSYEDEFDLVRWAITENVCRNPLKAPLDPRFTSNDRRLVFRTVDAPALTKLPPLLVAFEVERYPEFGQQGIIVGREVWIEQELRAIAGHS
jgi:hypothetical protein